MFKLSHHIQGSDQLLFSDITHTYTLANLSDERYALLAMTMLNGVLAALPGQFQIKIGRVRWQVEHLHAVEDPPNHAHVDIATKVAKNYTEEAVDVYSFAMHHICTRDHLQQF